LYILVYERKRLGAKEIRREAEWWRRVTSVVWLVVAYIIHCTGVSTETGSPFRVSQQNVNNEAEGMLFEEVMCVI